MSISNTGARDSLSSTAKRISDIQSELLDRTLVITLILGVLASIVSFTRTFETGFQIAHVIHFIMVIFLFVTVMIRKRISYRARYWILMAILLCTSVAGLMNYGLIGKGYQFLVVVAVLTSVFASRRISYIIVISGTVILIVFMILFTSGILEVSFDINKYFYSVTSWATLVISFVMWSGMLITISLGLFGNLKRLVEESSERLCQIQELNETLEKKVESRTKELKQSNRDKDGILGIVAHDINNKLGGILGYLSLFKENYESLSNRERIEYSGKAMEYGLLAKDIVKELMEFSRENYSEQIPGMEPVNMAEFVQSTVECHLPRAQDKRIDLKINVISGYAFCKVNRTKLSRVMDNLVTNALKFTPQGGTVTIDIETDDKNVIIRIRDTGIGIPDALKPYIFEPFSSSGRPGTEKESSTGLGLSISRKIVEQHGGTIWFESAEGKGSSFIMMLPIIKPEE